MHETMLSFTTLGNMADTRATATCTISTHGIPYNPKKEKEKSHDWYTTSS